MKKVVFGTQELKNKFPYNDSIKIINIDGYIFYTGIIEIDTPSFESNEIANQHLVFVKINGFSCNFRDKAIMLNFINLCNNGFFKDTYFKSTGSDFVGEVISVGKLVNTLKPGDRVISNASYPFRVHGAPIGIPSDEVSEEYKVFHYSKLIKISNAIDDTVGAAFTVGSITAYSMIRKLNLNRKDFLLVTSPKSNTSLFVIHALRKYKELAIYSLSSSLSFEAELTQLGIKSVFHTNVKNNKLADGEEILSFVNEKSYFNKVINPFHDLYFFKTITLMSYFSTYVTCGVYNQLPIKNIEKFNEEHSSSLNDLQAFNYLIGKNIEIQYNCLGLELDLNNALNDYIKGHFSIPIDSLVRNGDVHDFFYKTFSDQYNRFGKIVYLF